MNFQSAEQIIELARSRSGLPSEVEPLSREHLAQIVRRAAGVHCPCSAATLKRVVAQCLEGLVSSKEALLVQLGDLLEEMQAGGDLLELSDVTSGEALPGTWLFLAPPSFAMVTPSEARIFGLAAEEALPLPPTLLSRVLFRGANRILIGFQGEDLGNLLRSAGLRELSTNAWLRTPERTSAAELVARHRSHLSNAPGSDVVEGLRIFDPNARGVYVNKWIVLSRQTGLFLARRPQAFGTDLWAVVEAVEGSIIRMATLPLPGSRHRGCDEGWWLQLALDSLAGRPQEFRVRNHVEGVTIDLLFPIPLWSQRRLGVLGQRVERQNCVASFCVPYSIGEEEVGRLEEYFWMNRKQG